MKRSRLVFEKKDYVMILRHWHRNHLIEDYAHKDALGNLKEKMVDGLVFDLEDMPKAVVRLYSWVTVASASGWRKSFQMVLPYEMDIDRERLSVQSTLGAMVIGRCEGDILCYGAPMDAIKLRIEKVEQGPGRIKDYIPDHVFDKILPKQKSREFCKEIKKNQ
jgi:regulator of nucleoside diphosphate kinase